MRTELHKSSINIDHELGNDFAKLFSSADKDVTPFMSLFINTKAIGYVILSKVYGENEFEKNKFYIKLKKHNALALIKG